MITCIVSLALCVPPPSGTDVAGYMSAIRQVESSGNDNAVGDKGKAIGPYQIHRDYWKDALEYDPSIGGKYSDCFNEEYARKVVIAYMSRYAPNWNLSTIAGIHNGGPKGYLRKSTAGYRTKVIKTYKENN